MFKRAFTTILLITSLFLFPTSILAQDIFGDEEIPPSLTIAPSIIELEVKQNEDLSQNITISNNADILLPVKIEITEYTQDEYGIPTYSETDPKYSCKDWIQVTPIDFVLNPFESRDITMNVQIPQAAVLGSHFATILFKPILPPEYFKPQSAHILPYIGSVVALNVNIDEYKRIGEYLEVENFQSQNHFQNKPLEFSFGIKNKDVYYHKVEGNIYIYNFLNREIKKLNVDNTTIFPNKSRFLSNNLEKQLFGGFYTAKLKIGDDNYQTEKSISFFVIPSIMTILIFLLILGLSVLLILKRKNIDDALQVLFKRQSQAGKSKRK
ncbi:hypothetical protein ACFLY9_00045 [Patescibacteria group bacterium]